MVDKDKVVELGLDTFGDVTETRDGELVLTGPDHP